MPTAVRAHYIKLLLDWTQSALMKGKGTSSAQASASEHLQNLQATWQLLSVLLMFPEVHAQAAPNTTLITAAASACKACSPEHAYSSAAQDLAVTLQQTLLVLHTKFKQSFRPSLEHRLALHSQAQHANTKRSLTLMRLLL